MKVTVKDLTHTIWTPEMLERFKKAYAENEKRDRREVFIFDDREFVIGFANYLIQYLEKQFEQTKGQV